MGEGMPGAGTKLAGEDAIDGEITPHPSRQVKTCRPWYQNVTRRSFSRIGTSLS